MYFIILKWICFIKCLFFFRILQQAQCFNHGYTCLKAIRIKVRIYLASFRYLLNIYKLNFLI